MINKELNLNKNLFEKKVDKLSTRDGFGRGLTEAGEKDPRVVALTADLRDSTRMNFFAEKFPERFIEVGVAEQALATIASGMAAYGKIPFISSYAIFSPGRNWEQIRTTIALNNVPVKICASHTGLSSSRDGANHQCLEDVVLMRTIPNMVVITPCDAEETRKATLACAKTTEPTYLRFQREPAVVITTPKTPFKIGRAETFWISKNPQVAIIGCGPLLFEALRAAKELDGKGIESLVINCHTIKPLDERAIIKAAKITGAVVTVEEHQVAGGLGSAVAEVLAKNFPVPIEMVGVEDSFGESGSYDELLKKYSLTKEHILQAAKEVIKRKNN
jgi:transketolase